MAISLLDAWTFVDDDDPNLRQMDPSAGSNRVVVLAYAGPNHDISAFGWSVLSSPWGDQAPTASYKFGDSVDDSARYLAIWDETAIAARSDNTIDWVASIIAYEFFGWATYDGVAQTGLDALVNDSTNYSGAQTSSTLNTTSSSGDRIIAWGGLNTGSRQVTDWDTLTEKHDVAAASNLAKFCHAEGNGGDNSTEITNTGAARPNFASVVLVQSSGTIVPQAMHHYRNNGKIF